MSMFNKLKGMLGLITVTDDGTNITIQGYNGRFFEKDLKRMYGTTKVAKYMFTEMTQRRVVLPSFFALELEFILKSMVENDKIQCSRRVIDKILEDLKTNTWLKGRDEPYDNIIDLKEVKVVKYPPMPEQANFLNYYNYTVPRYNLNGALFSGSPGSGKTLGSIYAMLALKKKYIFVVAPKKAIWDVWHDSLTNKVNGQSVWVADSNLPLPAGTRWMIFHYQRLDEAIAIARKMRVNPEDVGIILDESHNMNNEGAAQTQNFITLCKESGSTDTIWASGTPIKAMGVEAIPLFRTIIPNFTDQAALAMKKIWSKGSSADANQIISNRLGVVSFSIPKSKFMSTVPVETTVKVTMPSGSQYTLDNIKILMIKFIEERFNYYRDNKPKFQKIYDDCLAIYKKAIIRDSAELADLDRYNKYVEMFIAIGYDPKTMVEESKFCNMIEKERIHPALPQHLRAPFKDAKSVIKYVDLKIKGECLGRILGKERIDCHVKLVDAIDFATYIDNSLKKTLIFTDFVPALEACQRKMVDIGYTPVVVYGDTNNELVSIVKDFRSIPDVNPCIATYRSLAEAVPLTEANTGLMINKPFRYHHYSQAVSRMHRIGQNDTVYVFNFVLDTGSMPNISTRSEDIMDWSKQQVDQLMGLNKYGSNVDVIDIDDLDAGIESLKSFPEGAPTDGSFLSSGNEDYLEMLMDEDLYVTEVSNTPVEIPRSNISRW